MTADEGGYMYPDEFCNASLCAEMKSNLKRNNLFILESCCSFPLLRIIIFLYIFSTKYLRVTNKKLVYTNRSVTVINLKYKRMM